MTLSAKELEQHKADMIFLRNQISQVKFELENLEEITSKLENLVEKFTEEPETLAAALQVFQLWLNGAGKQSSLRAQFLSMQKQWSSLSGIVDLKDVAVVREKEIAKGRAKLEVKKLEAEAGASATPVVDYGIFSRPTRNIVETPVSEVEDEG